MVQSVFVTAGGSRLVADTPPYATGGAVVHNSRSTKHTMLTVVY